MASKGVVATFVERSATSALFGEGDDGELQLGLKEDCEGFVLHSVGQLTLWQVAQGNAREWA